MKKFSLIAVAMTATLALSACGGDDEPAEETTPVEQTTEETAEETSEDVAEETSDMSEETGDVAEGTEDAASFSDPACEEFFTAGGPLADRAEAARAAIDNGEIVDSITMSEVTLLKSRLDATAEDAPEDISALILEVNAPFAEAHAAVDEGSEDVVDPESGAITLPEIDTQGSADAQAELETACAA